MLRSSLRSCALLVAFAIVCTSPAPASADVGCDVLGPSGTCLVRAGAGKTADAVDVVGVGTRASSRTVCEYAGIEIPCATESGTWVASRYCYVSVADPQPDQDSAVWEGHSDGAIYKCSPPVAMPGTSTGFFWAPSDPTAGPSPRALADRAVEAMDLRAGRIGMVPESGPGRVGIVGMPSWLWIGDPGESTVGPITRAATAGGVTVAATARLDRVEWSMGDGSVVTCAGAGATGTPYEDRFGASPSPTCGHVYTRTSGGRPGQAYTVTARSYWTVTWSGGGASGTIALDFSRSTQVVIGEVHVLVTG